MSASAVLGLLMGWSGIGAQVDLWAYDFFLRMRSPRPPTSVILAIDEDSIEAFGGLLRLREPLARALETLARHDPAAVAIDIVLSEPGSERENRLLRQAIASTPNVVLAAHLRTHSDASFGAWQEPLEPFRRAAEALGHVHADPDDDGVCRRVLLAKAAGAKRRWAMALEAFRLARGGGPIVETEAGLELGDIVIPARHSEQRALRIVFAAPESPIERISLKRLLEEPEAAAVVRGRVVFIGAVIPGGPDQFLMTPYSFGQAMSGVEINANVYETLAQGEFLVTVADSIVLAVALSFAAAMGLCFAALGGKRALLTACGLLLAAHLTPLIFFQAGRVLAFAPVTGVAWFCFLAAGGYHHLAVRGRLSLAETQRNRYQRAVHYVTHEMRTPLTTIQGSSELISRYALSDEKRKEIAGLIHQESVRLGRLVETFLSVEKLSAGALQLRREAVQANEILGVCIERVRPLAARKGIQILHPPGTREPLWGDRELLEYACYNLLTNAVKYSPARTTITVRAWHDSESIQLSVEDRGYGMNEAELKNIFRRFYRTPRAKQSGENGSGLGLAMVEEIVVQHGGSIEVESRVKQGSRFTLKLPRAGKRDLQRARAQ